VAGIEILRAFARPQAGGNQAFSRLFIDRSFRISTCGRGSWNAKLLQGSVRRIEGRRE